jgi:hypothetical protein
VPLASLGIEVSLDDIYRQLESLRADEA